MVQGFTDLASLKCQWMRRRKKTSTGPTAPLQMQGQSAEYDPKQNEMLATKKIFFLPPKSASAVGKAPKRAKLDPDSETRLQTQKDNVANALTTWYTEDDPLENGILRFNLQLPFNYELWNPSLERKSTPVVELVGN